MRRFTFPFALALCLVSVIALAAPDKVTAPFEALAASGITGEARLNPMAQQSVVRIQVQLRGLEPNAEYVALVSDLGTCTAGVGEELATFTANPAGNAVFHRDVSQDITLIGSISVALASDPTVLACAAVQ
jgi:hypothetical protein